jgi:hypothetical protein
MTFDEFRDKLDKLMFEFKVSNQKDMTTIKELMQFLDKRLVRRSKKKTFLKSLKGIL